MVKKFGGIGVADVLVNRHAVATMFLILVHQSIVALSAVFLTDAIENFQRGDYYFGSLLLYFFSMIFPYVPGYASFVTMQMWVVRSHKAYVEALIKFLLGCGDIYADNEMRLRVESAAARSSFMIMDDVVSFLHGFLSFLLNGFLSLFVIGLILPGDIFYGYLASVFLCGVLIIVTRRLIEDAASDSELSFLKYSGLLSRIWSNISLKNRINREEWLNSFAGRSSVYYGKKVSLEVKKQVVNFFLSMFSVLPTVFLLWVAIEDSADSALIAVIIVNLTRIFHILSSLSALVSESLDWTTQWARLKIIFGIFETPVGLVDVCSRISKEITVNGCPLIDVKGFIHKLTAQNFGRYTIRGGNGSGKSTLMLALKESLGEKGIYFSPVDAALLWPHEVSDVSTGQRALNGLHEIIADKKATHIILDEWDANLDSANVKFLDRVLDDEAKKKVVVEVRH